MVLLQLTSRTVCIGLKLFVPWMIELLFKVIWIWHFLCDNFFRWPEHVAFRTSPTGIELGPLEMEVWCSNHRTAKRSHYYDTSNSGSVYTMWEDFCGFKILLEFCFNNFQFPIHFKFKKQLVTKFSLLCHVFLRNKSCQKS